MEAPQWREEAGGTLVAETAKFTIKVRRTARRQGVRFVVLKRTDVLVGSGATERRRDDGRAAQRNPKEQKATPDGRRQ
jgi:hypothetical protein